MSKQLESSIVRIYNRSGGIAGAGFLVTKRRILTCAHVVADAFGISRNTPEKPTNEVWLDFSLITSGKFPAKVILWHPVGFIPKEEEDIAVLQVEKDLVADAKTARLVKSDDVWGHTIRIYGLPQNYDEGIWAPGVARAKIASGLLQIAGTEHPEYWVAKGFSGSPVWDEQLKGVIGMVVEAEQASDLKAAFIIPTNLLVKACPWLPVESPSQNEHLLTHARSVKQYQRVLKEEYPLRSRKKPDTNPIADVILPRIGMKPDGEGEPEERFKSLDGVLTKTLWKEGHPFWHAVLVGDGGMGKTSSLLKLWGTLLAKKSSPIPIFLRLEEYNWPEFTHKNNKFIWEQIVRQYLGKRATDIQLLEALEEQFLNPDDPTVPSLLLLLDGFNELTTIDDNLKRQIDEISAIEGIQIIMSSRYDMRETYREWKRKFRFLTLEQLGDDKVQDFIVHESGEEVSKVWEELPEGSKAVLRNPMMLALYCDTERESLLNKEKFIHSPRYKAEIFHNFLLSFQYREEQRAPEQNKRVVHELFLQHLLPRIGYEMEKGNAFRKTLRELETIITDEIRQYTSGEEFSEYYLPIYRKIGKIQEYFEKQDVLDDIITTLTKNYHLLRENKDDYEFIHQDFREYFAAAYLKKRIELDIKKCEVSYHSAKSDTLADELFTELTDDVLAPHLRQLLGELTAREGTLERALDVLRSPDPDIKQGDYRLLNILETLKDTRGDLDRIVLSELDLRHIVLNNIRLGLETDLTDSKVNIHNLFPQWHRGRILSVSYKLEPDGITIASAGDNGTIKEWDIKTGECLRTYSGHYRLTGCVSHNQNGSKIVSVGNQEMRDWKVFPEDCLEIKEWDTETGICKKTYPTQAKGIGWVSYNSDGTKIVVSSSDNTIEEWEVNTEQASKIHKGASDDYVSPASYSPDGNMIIWGDQYNTIQEWDVEAKELGEPYQETPEEKRITAVRYYPDGKRILSGDENGEIQEWNVSSKTIVKTYGDSSPHTDAITAFDYSRDRERVASASDDTTIKEWHTKTGKLVNSYNEHQDRVNAINYSPDGEILVSGSDDRTLKIWNVRSGKCMRTIKSHDEIITSIQYSSDGKKALIGTEQGIIKEWRFEPEQERCVKIYQGKSDCRAFLDYSQDGRRIITAGSNGIVEEWDCKTGRSLQTYRMEADQENFFVYNPDDNKLISVNSEEILVEWDVSKRACFFPPKKFEGEVSSINSHPQDKSRFLAGGENLIKEWVAGAEECINTYELRWLRIKEEKKEHLQEQLGFEKFKKIEPFINTRFLKIIHKNFSKDTFTEKLEELGFNEEQIEKNLEKREREEENILTEETPSIKFVMYHPQEEKILAVDDWTINEWELSSGNPLRTHESEYAISSACYSSDGQKVLFAIDGNRKIIKEWNIRTNEVREIYDEQKWHTATIVSVCYNPEGSKILSASKDSIREWDMSTGECIREIPNVFGLLIQGVELSEVIWERKLTPSERQLLVQYGAKVPNR